MKIPDLDSLVCSQTKVTQYLLSDRHPVGRTKAILFKRFGYSVERWSILAEDLKKVARENEISAVEKSSFGVRYIVDGVLSTPGGRLLPVRTVWFIDNDEQIPHFVTAYPR